MEPTRFQLTPEQKGMLASLLSETGAPVPTLVAAITEALEELQPHERYRYANGLDKRGREVQNPQSQQAASCGEDRLRHLGKRAIM